MIVLQKLLKCLKNWLGSAQKNMSTCIPSKKTFSTLLSLDSYSEILLKQFFLPFLCKTVTKMCSKLMWVPPKEMSLCNPSNYFHPANYESIQYDTVFNELSCPLCMILVKKWLWCLQKFMWVSSEWMSTCISSKKYFSLYWVQICTV